LIFMHSRKLAGALVVFCLLTTGRASAATDVATLFRVFLKDGSSLVSYGEFARVGDRVIFSMPTATTPNPPLHLVNLADDRVDWDKTNRYAASARATHYIETQAETDYLGLSNEIAQTLNDVSLTTDASKRLAIVERARKALAEWPANHFNYRSAEVRQMLILLDEAIADLRAASGGERFALDFSAFSELPPIREPLLTPPTAQEVVQQTLAAAQLSDSPAERTSLLAAAVDSIERSGGSMPADWADATLAATKAQIVEEIALDRTYQTLTKRMVVMAQQRAKAADVRGLQRLLERIHQRDAALGGRRPDTVLLLVREVETQLDAARQLRLARDRWALRAPDLQNYRLAISTSVDLFAQLKPALEDIKSLSGSTPGTLITVRRVVSQIVKRASEIEPPDELKAAHALLVSAAQLADNAARIRREATLAGDMARAWDASSAAAGALMLGAKARTDMQAQLRMPQLR
jgi:hypothetical protein